MHLRDRLLGNIATRQTPEAVGGVVAPVSPPLAEAPPVVAPPVVVAPEPPVTPPKKDWKEDRIAELTAKLNDPEELQRRLAAKGVVPLAPPAVPPVPGISQAEIDAQVNARAAEIAATDKWNERCNAVAEEGKTQFTDFGERLAAARSVLDPGDAADVGAWNGLLETAMETGKAAQIIYQLGSNPGEVKRLMGLSPVKQAMELTGLAAKFAAGGELDPSGAPAPIVPLGSKGLHYEGISPDNPENGGKLPIRDWMAKRQKQVEERGLQ